MGIFSAEKNLTRGQDLSQASCQLSLHAFYDSLVDQMTCAF